MAIGNQTEIDQVVGASGVVSIEARKNCMRWILLALRDGTEITQKTPAIH